MVVSCAAAHCTNRGRKGSGISFHSFPLDNDLRAKWLRAIGRENYNPNDFAKVCSIHFNTDDLINDKYNRRFIRKGAVPSRFLSGRKVARRKEVIVETVPEAATEVVVSSENIETINSIPEIVMESEETYESGKVIEEIQHNLDISAESICNEFPELLKPKTIMVLPASTHDTSFENTTNNLRQTKPVKMRKREIGSEDFEKINDTRLADPKVVKQLLSIAYKTIREQRKAIMTWRLKYKEMERKASLFEKALRELKNNQL